MKKYGFPIGFFIYIPLIVNGQYHLMHPFSQQSFSLAGGSYYTPKEATIWLDWRLDLGATVLALNQSNDYYFTPGLLQPNRYKWSSGLEHKNIETVFKISYSASRNLATLYATEPDLIIYGIKIFDSNGQMVMTEKTNIASSFLAKPIPITPLSNGVYYVVVYYLPASYSLTKFKNFSINTLKLFKQ